MTWKTAIDAEMRKANIKKTDLAKMSGLSKGYITELLHWNEDKRKKNPTFESIEKIARVFKMKGWQLWKRACEPVKEAE